MAFTPVDSALHGYAATMASADSCTFSTVLQQWLLFSEHLVQVSPGTTRFFLSIYLSYLFPLIPCSYGASAISFPLPGEFRTFTGSKRAPPDAQNCGIESFSMPQFSSISRFEKNGLLYDSNPFFSEPCNYLVPLKSFTASTIAAMFSTGVLHWML